MTRGLLAVLCAVSLQAEKGGCAGEDASTVKQDRINTAYWLYYDANKDVTHARVSVRFGNALGTILELLPPSKVTFNGTPLSFNSNLGWHEADFAGQVVGTFEYTNAEGTTFTTTVDPVTPIAFATTALTLPRMQAYTLAWSGAPIAKGEDLEVIVTADNPLVFQRFDQTATGATTIVLGADALAKVNGTPTGTMSMRRHGDRPANGPPAGATLRVTWQPKDLPVRYGP